MKVEAIILRPWRAKPVGYAQDFFKKKDKVSMFGRKDYMVEVTKAHDGAKLFHHRTKAHIY